MPLRRCQDHQFLTYVESDERFCSYPIHVDDIPQMPEAAKISGELSAINGVMGGVESWLTKSPSNNNQPIYPDFITVMIGTNDTGKFYFHGKDTKTPEDEKEVRAP